MLSKAKALYQVKLILDYLPEEEYKLIPKETIDYIEDNFEYDENFSIDPNIPLEKQKIDDKAFEMLDKIVKSAEMTKKENKSIKNAEMDSYLKEIRESNQNYNARIENIRLKNLVEILKKENSKIPKAKDLLSDYKDALNQKEDEIENLFKDERIVKRNVKGNLRSRNPRMKMSLGLPKDMEKGCVKKMKELVEIDNQLVLKDVEFKKENLISEGSFLIDRGDIIFIWVGKNENNVNDDNNEKKNKLIDSELVDEPVDE